MLRDGPSRVEDSDRHDLQLQLEFFSNQKLAVHLTKLMVALNDSPDDVMSEEQQAILGSQCDCACE
jgi:hypothetical protein